MWLDPGLFPPMFQNETMGSRYIPIASPNAPSVAIVMVVLPEAADALTCSQKSHPAAGIPERVGTHPLAEVPPARLAESEWSAARRQRLGA